MSDKTTAESVFKITIEGNASVASKDIASSARLASKAIGEYESEVKTLSADLRRLKGNSDQVVATKAALKKRIDEAKASASGLTAELLKQGTSYAAAAAAAKKYGDGVGKAPNLRRGVSSLAGSVGNALSSVGSRAAKTLSPLGKKIGGALEPVGKAVSSKLAPLGRAVAAKLEPLAKAMSGLGKAAAEDLGSVLPSTSTLLAAVGSAAAVAVAAVAALAVAFVAGGVALAAFGFAAAGAYAKMQRQREALWDTAQNAKNLGEQVSVLAGKVPQGTEEINQLALSLSKTRISGKAAVDALNAVSQVSGAVDSGAGAKIQELITRGDKMGRMSIGRFDLDGTGLDFDSVAKEYAAGTKKSVEAASRELRMGIAPIEEGAAALRKAAEKKFGDLNIRNAFSLENAPKRLKEQLSLLSSGVDLTPISKGLQDAFGQLDPNAPLGAAVKSFMTGFGGEFVDIAAKSIPALVEGIKWMITWGLKLGTVYYETKKQIRDAFNEDDWLGVGKAVVSGLVKGIYEGTGGLEKAVWNLGKDSIKAFKEVLGIHSPSKEFEAEGIQIPAGTAQGVRKGAQKANDAVENMITATPSASPGGSDAMSGGMPPIIVNFHGVSESVAKTLNTPSFLSAMSRAVVEATTHRGISIASVMVGGSK